MKKKYYSPVEIEIIEYFVERGFAESKPGVYNKDQGKGKPNSGEGASEGTGGDGEYGGYGGGGDGFDDFGEGE